MGPLLLRGLFAGVTIALGGCGMVLGIDDLVPDREPGTTSGGDGCSSTCGTPGCGACPGGGAVDVPSTNGDFRIDAHEVTNAEYQAWLLSNPTTAGQRFECEWNDTYRPGVLSQAAIDASTAMSGPPEGECVDHPTWLDEALDAGSQNAPVTCVDWCDADSYCRWAGKHLCARIGSGETIEIVDVTDLSATLYATANESAWYHACSNAGARGFPYGADYDATKCNDDELRPRDVGSYGGCVGGFPDLFDMSGNVAEWEDACTPFDPPVGQNCLVRGGCWYNNVDVDLACAAPRGLMRGGSGTGIGFRCCS